MGALRDAPAPRVAMAVPPLSALSWRRACPKSSKRRDGSGTKRVQRLLEATLRFKLPYNAYQHAERVTLDMLTGDTETYDLNGDYLDENGHEVTRIYIESKNVEGAGSQGVEFRRFLAQAYSATQLLADRGRDPKFEFMWATTCPWKGDGFRSVAIWEEVRDAVVWDRDRDDDAPIGGRTVPSAIPPDHQVSEDLARTVAGRLWVWVISNRHEDMTMGRKMRGWVHQRLAEEEAA
jgi:hypothetical protein